ncbi:MAG: hypothetical protein H7838_07280 [Magnetococcus sp. DMHC-8]
MSLPIKNIASHDGRLGDRPVHVAPVKEQAAETDATAAHGDFFGHFFSTPRMAIIRRKNQLLRDANDAVSLIQVADEALDTTTTTLGRLRILSTPDPTDPAPNPADRLTEQLALTEDVWSIAQQTAFNGQTLLNGQIQRQMYTVGEGPDGLISITIDDVGGMALALQQGIGTAVSRGATLGREAVADAQLALVDHMLGSVNHLRTTLDSLQTRFAEAVMRLQRLTANTLEASSRISDVGIAIETSTITREAIRQLAEHAVPVQANQQPQLTMRLLQ